jgi:hypothetical protein
METETICIGIHEQCHIIQEHKQEWAVCNTCGAQWAVFGSDFEEISEGDGYCLETAEQAALGS